MKERYVLQEYTDTSGQMRYHVHLTEVATVSFLHRENAEHFVAYLNEHLNEESLETQLAYMEGFVRYATEQAQSNRKDLHHAP